MMADPITLQIINDDGPNSPLLPPFIEALKSQSWVGELRITLPAENKSWIGTAMTRYQPLKISERSIAGVNALLVSGTPADCASLSVFNLYNSKPDLIVSGPNLGINSGLPYSVSSGTLGGATVGSLSGVPAIALSCELSSEVWDCLERKDPEEIAGFNADWNRLGTICATLAGKVYAAQATSVGRVATVNTPWLVQSNTAIRVTRIRPGFYGQLFKPNRDGTYSLSPHELLFDESLNGELTDDVCLQNNLISLSIFDPTLSSHVLTTTEVTQLASRL